MSLSLPRKMSAVQLTGHGGMDQLAYRTDVPVPKLQAHEVLIKVSAAGMNNTDINTRIGWYSKKVTGATDAASKLGFKSIDRSDSSWSGAQINFPRIQGADCCGRIVAVGNKVDKQRIGSRVVVRSMQHDETQHRPFECTTLGSESDGAFAQYVKTPARESYPIDCGWSDAELASIPCSYSTAENMLHRASVGAERVLITGASGGVGSAAVQLAKRRGAKVIAIASATKADGILALGADQVFDRNADLRDLVGKNNIDVVVDLVAGKSWPALLDILLPGGRYVTSGAIAGPLVTLDVRTLYLKDLTLIGCTFQQRIVFENLVSYIEKGEIRPLVAKTFALSEIVQAQETFLAKKFIGKLVLIPPA